MPGIDAKLKVLRQYLPSFLSYLENRQCQNLPPPPSGAWMKKVEELKEILGDVMSKTPRGSCQRPLKICSSNSAIGL